MIPCLNQLLTNGSVGYKNFLIWKALSLEDVENLQILEMLLQLSCLTFQTQASLDMDRSPTCCYAVYILRFIVPLSWENLEKLLLSLSLIPHMELIAEIMASRMDVRKK